MNYGNIKFYDIANGEGIRTSLFVSGCTNNCKGCFNKESQDFNYGQRYTDDTKNIIIEQISKPYIAGLSILGGDPMCQDNNGINCLIQLVDTVHKLNKTVWLWTGFSWEDFTCATDDFHSTLLYGLITSCDVVVDGPYVESLRDVSLKFRGSSNQRLIDVKKTLEQHKINLLED